MRWDLFVFGVFFVVHSAPAYAYVPTNVGGQIFQIVVPVLAVAGAGLSVFRRWLAAALRRLIPRVAAAAQPTATRAGESGGNEGA